MDRRPLWLLAIAACLAGCGDRAVQSTLDPATRPAGIIADLWWLMLAVLGAVTAIVFVLLFVALFLPRREGAEPPLGRTRFVVVGGIVVPAVILTGLLIASLWTNLALITPQTRLTIEVTGHQWWWEVRYPESGVVSANEIQIPAGEPVRLVLRSADVIHSFWVPRLNGKMDLMPGHTNEFWLSADHPGIYRGQCAEFCGAQHARMAFNVVALEPAEFEAWIDARRQPPPLPTGRAELRGLQAFFGASCHACHAIAGTPAEGRGGPDLTHVGSRLTLGAGTLPHTPETMRRWIANAQAVKPGNRMPPFQLTPEELDALQAYMESLK